MRVFGALAALLTALLALVMPQTPAQAAATGTYHHGYHVVYIENHASSFPIEWAVLTIRYRHPDVDVRYGACRSGAGCAKVYQMHRGRKTWPSTTYFAWYSGTHKLVEPSPMSGDCRKVWPCTVTKFDLDFPWTWHHRYQAACHEVLRGLGFEGQRYNLDSCSYAYLDNRASIRPDSWDIGNLDQVY
jgi:hypothetical protein